MLLLIIHSISTSHSALSICIRLNKSGRKQTVNVCEAGKFSKKKIKNTRISFYGNKFTYSCRVKSCCGFFRKCYPSEQQWRSEALVCWRTFKPRDRPHRFPTGADKRHHAASPSALLLSVQVSPWRRHAFISSYTITSTRKNKAAAPLGSAGQSSKEQGTLKEKSGSSSSVIWHGYGARTERSKSRDGRNRSRSA